MIFKNYFPIIFIVNIAATVGEDSGCNSPRLQSGEHGTFTSMNYPKNYVSNSKCEWLITVPATKIIKLKFGDSELETSWSKAQCIDSVKIFQGSSSNGEIVGEFCETFVVDRPYIIRSNQVFVIFQSDDRVERIGFKIVWSAVDNATNEIGRADYFKWNGGEYFVGTHYKTWWEARGICYNIWGKGNGDLVKIDDFKENEFLWKLMRSNRVSFAWIGASDRTLRGKFKWTDKSPLHFNNMSDYESSKRYGYFSDCLVLVTYNIQWTDRDCGRSTQFLCERKKTINTESKVFQSGEKGSFSSMNYPKNYNELTNNEWTITVPANKIIKLTFDAKFNVEKGWPRRLTFVCYDSIKVFKGSNSNGEQIGEYCGENAPNPIIVNNNQAFVTFNSDISYEKSGFRIRWSAIDKVAK